MSRMTRGLALLLASACWVIVCPAQSANYTIVPNLIDLPAGSPGATLQATVQNVPQSSTFDVCFYTGYGSTAPIVPDSLVFANDSASIAFQVPASAIQSVPPTAFTSGAFSALLYTVDASTTSCSGASQAQGKAATISLAFPTLTALSLALTPHLNPKLTSLLPSNISLTGTHFLSGSALSSVLFNSSNSIAGNVSFVSSTTLVSTIPTSLPLNVNSVSVQVCNTATYSYCSASEKLGLTTVPASPGVVNFSSGTALPSQPITVSATFGPTTPTVAGAPGGVVAFHYASTQLGGAPLILDKTGVFANAPAMTFQAVHPLAAPILADFNQDGIPDLLLPEAGSSNLHLLLGTTPSGSFAADHTIPVLINGSALTVLSVAVADFNSDGFPDVALLGQVAGSGSSINSVYLLLNDGSGNFLAPVLAFNSAYGSAILAGDFNHDGKQDILIAGALATSTGLQLLAGDGTGHFTSGPVSSGLNTAPSASFGGYKILAADFNNDGAPDIAVLNGGSADGTQLAKSIAIFQNNGQGSFTQQTSVATDATSSADFLAAPLVAGQSPAIFVISPSTSTISIAANQSSTAIAFSNSLLSTSIPGLRQAVAGEFNGDGLLDLLVDDGSSMHLIDGDGKGAFSTNYSGLTVPSTSGTTLLAASDENVDTFADLLTLTASAPTSGTTAYALHDYITAGTATATLPPSTFPVGLHVIQARTPGTFNIECGSVTGALTIAQATPTLTWPAPASIVSGTRLSATQLDATATGIGGVPLSGTFAYTPALGTILNPGTQTLTVLFTPADTDYTAVSATVSITVIPFSLNSLSTTTATLGDPAKSITLSGSGFLPTAVVQMDGTAVSTTFVNGTTLTAIIPASDFLTVHTIQVAVFDSSLNMTTTPLGISVTAPAAAVNLSGPTSIEPGTQIAIEFTLASAYPVDITATFTIVFTPATGLPDDPSVQFASGGRQFVVTIPAGTTSLAPIEIQSGTVAGLLTVATKLEAGGVDITPASVKPLTIQALYAVPGITSVTFSGNGNTLTVAVRGFSNTREMTGAKFHFTAVSGGDIETQDIAIDAQPLYAAWYGSDASFQYGSTCTYTQVFNLSTDASVVGQVSVILTNSQGSSPEANSP
jgi:hypothetical protein